MIRAFCLSIVLVASAVQAEPHFAETVIDLAEDADLTVEQFEARLSRVLDDPDITLQGPDAVQPPYEDPLFWSIEGHGTAPTNGDGIMFGCHRMGRALQDAALEQISTFSPPTLKVPGLNAYIDPETPMLPPDAVARLDCVFSSETEDTAFVTQLHAAQAHRFDRAALLTDTPGGFFADGYDRLELNGGPRFSATQIGQIAVHAGQGTFSVRFTSFLWAGSS